MFKDLDTLRNLRYYFQDTEYNIMDSRRPGTTSQTTTTTENNNESDTDSDSNVD
jgi:hypothetical protein